MGAAILAAVRTVCKAVRLPVARILQHFSQALRYGTVNALVDGRHHGEPGAGSSASLHCRVSCWPEQRAQHRRSWRAVATWPRCWHLQHCRNRRLRRPRIMICYKVGVAHVGVTVEVAVVCCLLYGKEQG